MKSNQPASQPTHQILIVDDHPLYRQGMVAALSVHLPGVKLVEADTAEAGFAALKASPDFDLVLVEHDSRRRIVRQHADHHVS